jgi:hypothetical protein
MNRMCGMHAGNNTCMQDVDWITSRDKQGVLKSQYLGCMWPAYVLSVARIHFCNILGLSLSLMKNSYGPC